MNVAGLVTPLCIPQPFFCSYLFPLRHVAFDYRAFIGLAAPAHAGFSYLSEALAHKSQQSDTKEKPGLVHGDGGAGRQYIMQLYCHCSRPTLTSDAPPPALIAGMPDMGRPGRLNNLPGC